MIHPNKYLFGILLMLSSVLGFAQTFELQGRVSIHNSKYENGTLEYVENVEVYAPHSKVGVSDYKGRFQLNFKGLKKDDVINIIVKKEGWEVANKIELDNIEIGKEPFIRIFLVKKGKLEQTKNELLATSQTAFLTLKDTFLFNLDVNKLDGQLAKEELEKRLGQNFSSTEEAKDFFQKTAKDIEQILPTFAKELAAVNLDFASDMYRTAFEHYKNGKIENAIVTIDETVLDDNLEGILLLINSTEDVEKLKKVMQVRTIQLNQIKDSYALKSKCLQQVFRFKEANKVNRKLEQMDLALHGKKELEVVENKEETTPIIEEENNEIDYAGAIEKETAIVPFDSMQIENEILDSTAIALAEEMLPKGNPKATTILEINDNIQTLTSDLKDFETALLVKVKTKINYAPDYEKNDSTEMLPKEIIVEEKSEIIVEAPSKEKVITSNPVVQEAEPILYVFSDVDSNEANRNVKPSREQFSITKKTSLRRGPSSKTKVLKRLNVGTKVTMIEKINRYWCRVLLNGKEGYVKVLLLEKVD